MYILPILRQGIGMMISFEKLGLTPAILNGIKSSGFTVPTPVQVEAIPYVLTGQDLMVSSHTGSGKTAAFILPALQSIISIKKNLKGSPTKSVLTLVLTPTRELAQQIASAAALYGKNIPGLHISTVVGGTPYRTQLKALSRRVDLLVATPGRLIDHIKSNRVKMDHVKTFILDEADRMLDMGFIEDIKLIVQHLPKKRQTLLFSATLDGDVTKLISHIMENPRQIELTNQKQKHENITQILLYADDSAHKKQLLSYILSKNTVNQAIVFTSTKRGADTLTDYLLDQGFSVAALHGDMNQRQRTRTLSKLQRRQFRILVATDIAARGIDVEGLSHAVNFDLPMQAEDYIHRIGRTGRAGRNGSAITLAMHSERHKIKRIENYIGQTISSEIIVGLEPKNFPKKGNKIGYKIKSFPKSRKRTFSNSFSQKNQKIYKGNNSS
ncbi:MAG: DEAD/DEAH box helicase [Bordetella sp.]|nr:MAG: DEAD/DEAH box helicase [Bordetella sp.]